MFPEITRMLIIHADRAFLLGILVTAQFFLIIGVLAVIFDATFRG